MLFREKRSVVEQRSTRLRTTALQVSQHPPSLNTRSSGQRHWRDQTAAPYYFPDSVQVVGPAMMMVDNPELDRELAQLREAEGTVEVKIN